jgi:MftR C-terminal domain
MGYLRWRPSRASSWGDAEVIARAAILIGESTALQVREREIVARYIQDLAELLAAETGARPGDIEPWTVAAALMGVHRALINSVRASALAGRQGRALTSFARSQARRAFGRLESGLADYGIKRIGGTER